MEAEKAARALEVAAVNNPLAQLALEEARYLIAQATQMLDSIEQGPMQANSSLNNVPSPDSDTSDQVPSKLQINGKNTINFNRSALNLLLDGRKEAINGCRISVNGLVGGGDETSRVEEEDEKSGEFRS